MTDTHRTRLETCLSGAQPDRVPVALWRHFPGQDRTPKGFAEAHLAFFQRYQPLF